MPISLGIGYPGPFVTYKPCGHDSVMGNATQGASGAAVSVSHGGLPLQGVRLQAPS
jgi:hypothetical protein